MTEPTQPTGHDAIALFESQGVKQPGTYGFWQVWGARTQDIRPGDLLLSRKGETNEVCTDYVTDVFTAKSSSRAGFIDADGNRFTIGILAPMILCRWGTHGTLADSVR
jgi:hypothetical protein